MVRKAGTMGGHRLPTNRWAPAFGQEAADHLICSYFATCHWCWKHSNKVLRVACQAHTFLDLPFFHFWLFVLGDLPSQCAHCCTAHLVFAHNSGFPNCWLKWLLCGCFMFQLIAHSSFTTVVSEIRLVGIEHWSWCYREDLFRTAPHPSPPIVRAVKTVSYARYYSPTSIPTQHNVNKIFGIPREREFVAQDWFLAATILLLPLLF